MAAAAEGAIRSINLESDSCLRKGKNPRSYRRTLLLAYQSMGVVFGHLSTSPIYVYTSTFAGKMRVHEHGTEVYGVLSLVFWTLTLIALCKYIIIVLCVDDNGEGGTFALYSKLCRNSMIGLTNDRCPAYEHLSPYESEVIRKETKTSLMIKSFFEKHQKSRIVLFFVVLLGTSMLVGDGVLTPTMSVLSAASGIKIKAPELHDEYIVVMACFILVGLFALQHCGTHRVGFLFAPVLIAWLGCITLIGMYNILKWNPLILQALSPHYIYKFFKDCGKEGWSSLGGVVLCITGAEAIFADLGHFSKLSLRLAFTALVYPSLVLSYMGEAAYLSKHTDDLRASFYSSIPDGLFWPVFVVATLATIVASQATISATFSIISQCRVLDCFPRVKIIHTSKHVHGQIYIPEINWLLLILCLSVTIGFRDPTAIGNAYGLAAITVMFVTTCLMSLIITTVWKLSILTALLFTVSFGSLELLYFLSSLAKVPHGGWFPLALSLLMLSVTAIWHYGTSRKRAYELQNMMQIDNLLCFGPDLGLVRVPGIGLVYSSTPDGVPPMFAHFITNFPVFHQVLIFISLQTIAAPKVPTEDQIFIGRVGPPELLIFRCVIRYGYKDVRTDVYDFEDQLLTKVVEFLQQNGGDRVVGGTMPVTRRPSDLAAHAVAVADEYCGKAVELREEVKKLVEQREAGMAYMIGQTCVLAHESSSLMKKVVINHVYGFLRRNCRQPAVSLGVPHASLIEVGMVYRV